MTFSGRRPRERDFFCSHCASGVFSFAFCVLFSLSPSSVVYTLKVDHRSHSWFAVYANNKDSPD